MRSGVTAPSIASSADTCAASGACADAQGVLLDPLARFGPGAGWHGVLLAYGHMGLGQLRQALRLVDRALSP